MNYRKRLQKVMAAPQNVQFGEMVTLVQAFGFANSEPRAATTSLDVPDSPSN